MTSDKSNSSLVTFMRRLPAPLFIFLLLALCVGLVWWQKRAASQGKMSMPASASLGALGGANRVLDNVGGWFGDVGKAVFVRNSLAQQNAELRTRVADLESQNQSLTRLRSENDELRALLKTPRTSGGKSIAADVVALDASNFSRRVTLNVGSRSGVRAKDVVYAAQGVAGQVIEVSPFNCVVLLVTDGDAGAIGAMTSRTSAKGLLFGTGQGMCRLEIMSSYQADVREGDLVLTSGLSDIFPRGLVLGRVRKVTRDRTYSRLTAEVEPAAPMERLSAVWVRTAAGP